MDKLLYLGLICVIAEPAASIKLQVPPKLEPGVGLYTLNATKASGYRYLVSNDDGYANAFFLANGLTLTTHGEVDLPPEANVNLAVLEEGLDGSTKVIPIELRPFGCEQPLKLKGHVKENEPAGTPVPLASNNGLVGELKSSSFALTNGRLVTKRPLDREKRAFYKLNLTAPQDPERVLAFVDVEVENVNDNLPVFNVTSTKLLWKVSPTEARKYAILGKVSAFDPDGDEVVYGLDPHDPCCIVVPQTGEVMLVNQEALPAQLTILAKEKANQSRQSRLSAIIDIINEEDEVMDDDQDLDSDSHVRRKRRATRAVRPTKRTEFSEADGQVEGKIVFQLEKESEHETFKIRDENPWVTVEPNGAVRVKKRWDYEELGREKTIDFWVIITNSGAAGTFIDFHLLLTGQII